MKLIINLFKTIAVIFGFPFVIMYYFLYETLEVFAKFYDDFFD